MKGKTQSTPIFVLHGLGVVVVVVVMVVVVVVVVIVVVPEYKNIYDMQQGAELGKHIRYNLFTLILT